MAQHEHHAAASEPAPTTTDVGKALSGQAVESRTGRAPGGIPALLRSRQESRTGLVVGAVLQAALIVDPAAVGPSLAGLGMVFARDGRPGVVIV